MARTVRAQPLSKSSKWQRLEREWERNAARAREKQSWDDAQSSTPPLPPGTTPSIPAQVAQPVPAPIAPPSDVHIQALTTEAQRAMATRAAPGGQNFSRQDPPDGPTAGSGNFLWWSGGNIDDFIPLAEYGTQQRQSDLRTFALVAPMIMIAESVLIKKMQALQWSIESGRNRAIHWQRILATLEQDKGWDTFIARWTRSYCEADVGGYAEIIRHVPSWAIDSKGELTPRGNRALQNGDDRAWPIVDSKVMDPCRCLPSADPEFPLVYHNPYTSQKHRLRPHQFMHILDMPSVDDSIPNYGVCAVSRAVWAAQEDRMVTRYGFEALSENPGTGMVLANVNQNLLETALQSAKAERDARGVVYYKGLIFLPILDPSGNVKLEYLTFSHLPENFNRTEDYSRIKELVASAFGMDVLELGSIPGHNLGTAQQASIAASKARGKGIGALIQGVEREFRHKFLPQDVQLRIKKHDVDELAERAELDSVYFANAVSMLSAGGWNPIMANQYLADLGAIQPEFPYMSADLTPSEELEDTEATEKRLARDGPPVSIDREGRIKWLGGRRVAFKAAAEPDVPARLDVADMVAGRALWAKYMPDYADLTQ